MHPKTYESLTIRDDVLATLHQLSNSERPQAHEAFDHLQRMAREGNHAGLLRRQHASRGSSEGLVDTAVACWRA